VRDAVLKRPVRDIDLALALPPERVTELLEMAAIKVVQTGFDHGTVTAVLGSMQFEITTLRIDVESFGRRARVAFTDDWIADAARRDFTFNALSCTPGGDVYDYFGGLEDLGHGRVRFVGDPRERIAEDVLRLLRFFRFYAHYGRPPPDPDALAACKDWAGKVQTLSGERVRAELFRILMASDPADVFQLMRDWDVLQHVLPEADGVDRLRTLSWLDSRALRLDSVAPDPVRRLAALLDTDTNAIGIDRIAERLKLSNRQRKRLAAMVGGERQPVTPDADDIATKRALYHLGTETTRDLALLAWASELVSTPRPPRGRNEGWTELLQAIDRLAPPVFPLRGRDALSLGLAAGPRLGEVLRDVERWWEEGGFAADREACLARLRMRVVAGNDRPSQT
jgi:poly(A) polymerase